MNILILQRATGVCVCVCVTLKRQFGRVVASERGSIKIMPEKDIIKKKVEKHGLKSDMVKIC